MLDKIRKDIAYCDIKTRQVRALEREEDVAHTIWLRGLDFPVSS
jgi:hypothetical protein